MRQDPIPLMIVKQFFKKITGFFQKIISFLFSKTAAINRNKPLENDDSSNTIEQLDNDSSNLQEESIQENFINIVEKNELDSVAIENIQQIETSNDESPFLTFPLEILSRIIENLSLQDLGRISQVSKKCNTLMENEYLWKRLAFRKGIPLVENNDPKILSAKNQIKECSIKCHFHQLIIDLFGSLDLINELPILKYPKPIKKWNTYLNLDNLAPDLLKGNKIMRGIGMLGDKHVPFIAFCVKKVEEPIEEAEFIQPQLEAIAVYFNPLHNNTFDHATGFTVGRRIGPEHTSAVSDRIEHGSSRKFQALKQLISDQSCKGEAIHYELNNMTLMLTDQSEFDLELKERKRLLNK